jgi:protoporphyrinogen oxidase
VKIAILGAGVTGLALARFLIEGGPPPVDPCSSVPQYRVAEKTTGARATRRADHVYLQQGPPRCPDVGHAGGEAASGDAIRHAHPLGGPVRYPFENGLGDLTPQANFECIATACTPGTRDRRGSTAPADFKSWIRWRFGDGIAEHFMDPYNEKIWKRDLAEITSDWVAGRVPDAPVDDVLRASVGIPTEGYTHQAIFYYPLHGGFQAITDGLAAPLLPRIRLSTPVREIERTRAGARVNGEDFDLVVSTLPLNELPEIVRNVPASIADAMRGLAYNGLVSLLIALDRPEHPDLPPTPQRARAREP